MYQLQVPSRSRVNRLTHHAAWLLALAAASLLPACGGGSTPSNQPGQRIAVVTTSNIVADWVTRIGGDSVDVFSLLPVASDPHTFSPGARDITRVAQADLIVTVGLGMEAAWLDKLIENAAADASRIVVLANAVDPLGADEPPAESDPAHPDGEQDPHFWLDPLRAEMAVAEITRLLSARSPDLADTLNDNSRAYSQRLQELHRWAEDRLAAIPEARRRLVTAHRSLGYFAERYGFQVVGAIAPSTSTADEPSAKQLSDLVGDIVRLGAPAVFTESTSTERLPRRIAEEAGIPVVQLYTGSLGPADGNASTYIDMMRANVDAIVGALQ